MLNNAAAYIIILFNAVVYIIVYKMNIKKNHENIKKYGKIWKIHIMEIGNKSK